MKKWFKGAAVLALASSLALTTAPHAAAFSSGSSGGAAVIPIPMDPPVTPVDPPVTPVDPSAAAEAFEADVKQMYSDKGYTLIEAPELLAEYAIKAQNSREVTYLPNGNGLFGDSFGHILDGYFPKANRLEHYDYRLRLDFDTSIVLPADEGERAAIDVVSDDTYYYIVIITFTDLYKG